MISLIFKEEWDYTEEKPRTGELINAKKRIYPHFYYNDPKATDDKTRFNTMLYRLENTPVNGTSDFADEKLYQKYFTIHEIPVRGKTTVLRKTLSAKQKRTMVTLLL
ncbi:hypothetical protein [Butyrivibrio fibrisolvens]|uniref:hypothetical protein n=1 Tax=Butyrivibrio fibrisolvens TaxID=831 RepID=UPI0004833610|nr:hypothetical protein [Butyrivibrio fibrisolvens]